MASNYVAKCDCGYHSTVLVGGLKRDYLKKANFPFFCNLHGLINVNYRQLPIFCPYCNSENIKPYGRPPISVLPDGDKSLPVIQAEEYSAYGDKNLCPDCRLMTLSFQRPKIYILLD